MRDGGGCNIKILIGQLAKETETKIETIRFYEKHGLLKKPSRSKSGYREFGQLHIDQVNFIKLTKALGFTLKEISKLLSHGKKNNSKFSVRKLIDQKLSDNDSLIKELKQSNKLIQQMLNECLFAQHSHKCVLFAHLSPESSA